MTVAPIFGDVVKGGGSTIPALFGPRDEWHKNDGKLYGVRALVDGQYCDYAWVVDDGIGAPFAVELKTPHIG